MGMITSCRSKREEEGCRWEVFTVPPHSRWIPGGIHVISMWIPSIPYGIVWLRAQPFWRMIPYSFHMETPWNISLESRWIPQYFTWIPHYSIWIPYYSTLFHMDSTLFQMDSILFYIYSILFQMDSILFQMDSM